MKFQSFGITDTGRVREHNEDALLTNDKLGLFIVADGLGGHNAGEVASRMTTEVMESFTKKALSGDEITWPYGPQADLTREENIVASSILLANREVADCAASEPEHMGMATTVVSLLIHEGEKSTDAIIGNVGDSRIYRLRGSEFEQISEDHSLVGEQYRAGLLTREQMDTHPQRNIITRAVGSRDELEVDIFSVEIEKGDLFLLCSDGLNGELSDAAMCQILLDNDGSLKKAGKALVDAALEAGGRDNVTIVLVKAS
ncbi:MAG: Stp1/IreP family PP2C-type Ser/Thr phosphatase [Chrysiogenetes bacterium]|nr:Stp1/IreP family PP2C-type Ser/Thr phosphatase [Chrysiogenetes bacterium]